MSKKLIIFSLFCGLLFGLTSAVGSGSVVLAEEADGADILPITADVSVAEPVLIAEVTTEPSSLVDPGLTPDSVFYPFKLFFENIGSTFTFGNLAKANRFSNLAEKRMAEAKIMMEKGEEKSAENALNRYQNLLDNSLKRSQQAQGAGQDSSEVQAKISQMTENHLLVLEKVLEQVPESAKTAIEKVIEKAKNTVASRQMEALENLGVTHPQQAIQLNGEILERRTALMNQKIEADDEFGAGAGLIEWQKHAYFLRDIKEENKGLASITVEETEKALKDLQGVRDQAGVSSSELQMAIRDARSEMVENQLDFLEALKIEIPEEAALLFDKITKERFASLSEQLATPEDEISTPEVSGLGAVTRLELRQIGDWLQANGLNEYGDSQGTMYAGGDPLFDESAGVDIDGVDYILGKYPNRPWKEMAKENRIKEQLQEHAQYIGLWQGMADQIETNGKELSVGEETREESLYQFNSERLQELNTLYEKLSPEDKGSIEEMMTISEGERQRIEMNASQLQLKLKQGLEILIPERVHQAVQTQLQQEAEIRIRNQVQEGAGQGSSGGNVNSTSPNEVEDSDSTSPGKGEDSGSNTNNTTGKGH